MEKEEEKKNEIENGTQAWIEFARIGNARERKAAVRSFFSSPEATTGMFASRFGISLEDFPGFYLEVAVTDAPRGPLMAGVVKPILVLRQSKSGKTFSPHIMQHEGLLDHDQTHAWIRAEEWDDYVQDTFMQEVNEERARKRELAKKAAAELQDTVDELKELDGNTEA